MKLRMNRFFNPIRSLVRPITASRMVLTRQLSVPVLKFQNRQLSSTKVALQDEKAKSLQQKLEEEEDYSSGGESFKGIIISSVFGILLMTYWIVIASQLPLDPERMTQEKLSKMSEAEQKKFEEDQMAKGMLGAIMDMFPSWWRWREAFWTVVEKASLKTWFGLKLGWDYFTESKAPEWKIALPRPLGEGYPQTKFTVTMELLDVIFVSHFDPVQGWLFKLRPGAIYLFSKIGFPKTELVTYTEASPQDLQPLIQKLLERLAKKFPNEANPPGPLYQLYRNSCAYDDGNYKKDLRILGRDYRNIIHIDVNDYSYLPNDRRNVILIKKPSDLKEGEKDMVLYDLADLLESINNDSSIYDVREKLEEYSHDENGEKAIYPTEQFRRIQTELELKELEKQQELKEYEEKFGKTSIKKKAFGRFL